ncbi:MAG: hypothetical protein QXU81_00100 [Candidatus Bathyarchaeia archaeon]
MDLMITFVQLGSMLVAIICTTVSIVYLVLQRRKESKRSPERSPSQNSPLLFLMRKKIKIIVHSITKDEQGRVIQLIEPIGFVEEPTIKNEKQGENSSNKKVFIKAEFLR